MVQNIPTEQTVKSENEAHFLAQGHTSATSVDFDWNQTLITAAVTGQLDIEETA